MIDGRKFFDQPMKNDQITYDNIQKIAAGQGDDYTTGCLRDCPYFKEHYKMISIGLSKQLENFMLIQKQSNKLILLEIQLTNLEQEIQQCFSLLEKQKKLF